MRLALATRRVVAVVAATALTTSGGLLSGVLVDTASAQGALTVSPTVVNNSGSRLTTFTLTGTSFYPSAQDTIIVKRNPQVAGQQDYVVKANDNSARCASPVPMTPDDNCGTTLTFTIDLVNAAPGSFDLTLEEKHASPLGGADYSTPKNNAFQVLSPGTPVVTSSKAYLGTTSTPGQLEIAGNYLTKGSTLDFVTPVTGGGFAVDPGLSFTPTVDGGSFGNGNVDATVLRGTYTQDAFTAGTHYLRVTNPLGQAGVSAAPFHQPRTTSIDPSPTQLGQGASNRTVTLTGQGYAPGSTLFVGAPSDNLSATDVHIAGNSVAAPDGTSVAVPLSVDANATVGSRVLSVRGPDGDFFNGPTTLTITPSPKVTSVSPSPRGQGFAADVTVAGSGLLGTTTFDFGPGVGLGTTKSVNGSGTSATVGITIAPDAALGGHTVTATNPDGGTSTFANGFSVTAAPKVTSLSPPSADPGQTRSVDVLGTGFVNGALLSASSGTGLTITKVTYVDATHLTADFTASPSASYGPHDVKVTNPDGGTSTLVGGFGVNSLTVITTAVSNAASTDIVIQGAGIDLSTPVSIVLPGNTDQGGPIAGNNKSFDSGTGRLTVTFPLTKKAAGLYTVTATPSGGPLTCTGCLTVGTAVDPAALALTPAVGGRGAVNRAITVTGSGLSYGQTVSFGTGVITNSTSYVPASGSTPDSLLVSINIDPAATLGARDVVVSNVGQPSSNGTKTGGFTVNAAPTVTTISPATLGQGTPGVDVSITGTLLAAGATVSFGPDITTVTKAGGTATSFVATTTVGDTASTTSPRTATVTNPDGGVGTLASALTITPAPRLTSLSPNSGYPGTTLTQVAFVGSGFTSTVPSILINGVNATNVVVTDATHLTADLAIASNATLGVKDVLIKNADFGQSTLPNGFTIATVPVAPTSIAVTPGDKKATVTWSFPTAAGSDGGSALTGFVVDDGNASTNNAVTVTADKTSADLTGLVNGTTYTFTVRAINSVGTGPAGTATGTPFGTPLAPTSVSGSSGESQVLVSWVAANAQGSPVTQYTVTSTPATTPVVVSGSARSAYVTGLTNGTAYTFVVTAKNAAGSGPVSQASAPVTPKFGTLLSGAHHPSATTTSGTGIAYTGYLTRASSRAGIAGATVVLSLRPDVGPTKTVNVTTNGTGYWRYVASTVYNTLVNARYDGSSSVAGSSSAAYKVLVATRVTITSPTSGGTTSKASPLVVKGTTSPNKAGRTVALYRVLSGGRLQAISSAKVLSNGSFSFSVKLGAGDYQLKVGIGGTSGNIGGGSATFVAKRR